MSYEARKLGKQNWRVWNGFADRWHMSMGRPFVYGSRKSAEAAAGEMNELVPHRYEYGNSISTKQCMLTTYRSNNQGGPSYCCGRDLREHVG